MNRKIKVGLYMGKNIILLFFMANVKTRNGKKESINPKNRNADVNAESFPYYYTGHQLGRLKIPYEVVTNPPQLTQVLRVLIFIHSSQNNNFVLCRTLLSFCSMNTRIFVRASMNTSRKVVNVGFSLGRNNFKRTFV